MAETESIKLFSKMQVSLATFLGTPIAGAFLISKNYKTLGDRKAARQIFILGIFGTVVTLSIAFFLPDNFPNLVLPLAYIIMVRQWYEQRQENAFKTHISNGGKKGSWGTTVGIGLLFLLVILAVMIGVIMILPESIME